MKNERKHNVLVFGLLFFCVLAPSSAVAQHSVPKSKRNPGSTCGSASQGLPNFYYRAVLSHIEPPDWDRGLIRIKIGGEIKLSLVTDGLKFKIWTNIPDVRQKTIYDFLMDLDDHCRLPADPSDAFALIKFKWESKELSPEQFATLHREFSLALSQLSGRIQDRYSEIVPKRKSIVLLDTAEYSVVYDNSYVHVEFQVPEIQQMDTVALLRWVNDISKFGDESFKRTIWPRGRVALEQNMEPHSSSEIATPNTQLETLKRGGLASVF